MLSIPVEVSLVLKMEESRSWSCSILLGISPNPGMSLAYNIDAHCVEILLRNVKKLLNEAKKKIENHRLHREGVYPSPKNVKLKWSAKRPKTIRQPLACFLRLHKEILDERIELMFACWEIVTQGHHFRSAQHTWYQAIREYHQIQECHWLITLIGNLHTALKFCWKKLLSEA